MSDRQSQLQKFGRAFNAAVSTDWLITEEYLRTMLEVAARIHTPIPGAVDPQNEPGEWDDRSDDVLTIRNGVAVIPVTGPIFRYASFFTYYCGGVSVDKLARNLNAALTDSRVTAIMFEINSPGGEVTGISEFAQQVYRARSIKPITARVGGYGCSAAYWIAAMCGDVAIDQTAQLGSIGVMAVYLDDRKNLEMEGFEELEFISSQSPYKNSPPWEAEGKTRIQKRIDALADVFVKAVAVGRGVSVKTVLESFGQGDVFVGQAAIDAGLADRFGSFTDTIDLLATAHTTGYTSTIADEEPFPDPIPDDESPGEEDDADPDEDGDPLASSTEKTITGPVSVNSQPVDGQETAEVAETVKTEISEELMSQEKEKTTPATATEHEEAPATVPANAAEKAKVEGGEPTPAPADAKAKGGEQAATDSLPTDVATLQKQLAESKARIDTLEADALDKWLDEQTASLAGEPAANKTVLGALVAAHGKDGAEVQTFLKNQTAMSEQLKAGGLFAEIGRGGADTTNTAEAQLEAKAKELMTADSKLTIQQARSLAYEQNPDLYAAMQGAEG